MKQSDYLPFIIAVKILFLMWTVKDIETEYYVPFITEVKILFLMWTMKGIETE